MKMITKVFLIIAILLICLLTWALFFNKDGILQNAWNGVAGFVNETWTSLTGAEKGIIPEWNIGSNLGDAQDDVKSGQTGAGGSGN